MQITKGQPKLEQKKFFSKEDLTRLQNQRSFTDNDMESIENATRVVFGKSSVEAGIREKRKERNHYLDPLFDCKNVVFKQKPKKKKDTKNKGPIN